MDRSHRSLVVAVAAVAVIMAVAAGIGLTRSTTPRSTSASPAPIRTAIATVASRPSPSLAQSPSPPLRLRVNGLATIASPTSLVVRQTPTSTAKSLRPGLLLGDIVYMVGGPTTVEGVDWWQVASDRWSSSASGPLFGWVPATGDTSIPNIVPFASACPSEDRPIESEAVARIGALQALACFGDRDITVSGELRCSEGVRDGGAGGASWLNSYWWCSLDDHLAVNGPSIDALRGRVLSFSPTFGPALATGHFDDREARQCAWVPVGVSLDTQVGDPDPAAVFQCRQQFVVTGLTGPGGAALDGPSATP